MAEAHEAVAFQFTVGAEGVSFNVSYDVFKALVYSGFRSWKLRCHRTINHLHNTLYPGHPLRGIGWCGAIYILRVKGYDPSNGIIEWLDQNIFRKYFIPEKSKMIACLVFGSGTYMILLQTRQYILKKLFSYHGWMYQDHGKPPGLGTKIWGGFVKLFVGRNPTLYSYQSLLPTLPLPSLDDTLNRYLRTVRPLYDDEEYERTVLLAEEFKQTIGRKLQRYLWLKWLVSSNYVSDWWEKFVYLRGRSPIMVNSNYYGLDAAYVRPTKVQTARAANAICSAFRYRIQVDHETIRPLMVQNMIPLCSSQYERQFNTVRIPGKESDRIVHYSDSHHVAVYHKGRWYRVFLFYQNELLEPCEIQLQLDQIIQDTRAPDFGEERLAALTAGERTLWAEAREKYFSTGVNRSSLEAIERAAFVIILDDEACNVGVLRKALTTEEYESRAEQYDAYAHSVLHGNGHNRWFDKSFNFIISSDAVVGINVEHSWADAPISGQMYEFTIAEDIMNLGYDEFGNTRGVPRFTALKPIKLKWSISEPCNEMIEKSLVQARALYDDVDLHVYVHDDYGKRFMKKCKLSPDAYLQMALQLAHYRDSGRFNLTYEASMTRLFRDGRTETVRACSIESCDWVKAMEDPSSTKEERIRLLRRACDYHQQQYRDAMTGKGIDRHLFCLYVLSKYLEIESPFLQQVLHEPWKLSTSQTPANYDDSRFKSLVAKNPDAAAKYGIAGAENLASIGGGFGPVAADGYGVSYIIASEDLVFFHISSNRSSPETDSRRFGQRIRQAMEDIRALFEQDPKTAPSSNNKENKL